jgi:hypothetical protein
MRAVLLSMVFFPWACGPKVSPTMSAFDEDLPVVQSTGPAEPVPAAAMPAVPERPVAAPGKGLRSGTISRERLLAVLNAGAGTFLRQLELAPKLNGQRFVGWELVQLVDKVSPLVDVDLVPGDVLLAINGKPIRDPTSCRPSELSTANEVTAQLWRGEPADADVRDRAEDLRPVEDADRMRRIVGEHAVDAERREPLELERVVDGPRVDRHPGAVPAPDRVRGAQRVLGVQEARAGQPPCPALAQRQSLLAVEDVRERDIGEVLVKLHERDGSNDDTIV